MMPTPSPPHLYSVAKAFIFVYQKGGLVFSGLAERGDQRIREADPNILF